MAKSAKAKALSKWLGLDKFDPTGWECTAIGVYVRKVDGSTMTYNTNTNKVEWRGKTWHGVGAHDIGNFIKNRDGHAHHEAEKHPVSVQQTGVSVQADTP